MNGLQTHGFPCTFYGTVGFPCTLNYYLLQLYGTVGIGNAANVTSSADCAQHFLTHAKCTIP